MASQHLGRRFRSHHRRIVRSKYHHQQVYWNPRHLLKTFQELDILYNTSSKGPLGWHIMPDVTSCVTTGVLVYIHNTHPVIIVIEKEREKKEKVRRVLQRQWQVTREPKTSRTNEHFNTRANFKQQGRERFLYYYYFHIIIPSLSRSGPAARDLLKWKMMKEGRDNWKRTHIQRKKNADEVFDS